MTTSENFFWTKVVRLHHRCTSKRDAVWARSFTTRLQAVLFLLRCWQNTTSLSTVVARNAGKKEQYVYRCKCCGSGRSRWSAKISTACCEYLFPNPFETLPTHSSAFAVLMPTSNGVCFKVEGNQRLRLVTSQCMRVCQKRIHWCFAHWQILDGTFLEGGIDSNAALIQHWYKVVTQPYSWHI
jgi:uncharacterized DUF497 family protein